jgi:hypothetical protein
LHTVTYRHETVLNSLTVRKVPRESEMAGRMDVGVRLNAALAQGLGVERGTDEARGGKEKCVEKWEGFGVNWDSSEDSD